MDDLDYELLAWLERGNSVFSPVEPTDESRREFQDTARRILQLRERGMLQVAATHVSQTESGEYMLIGPCALSAEGRASLAKDRRLGPRPPRPNRRVPSR